VYVETQAGISGVPVTITGTKSIGTDAAAQPVIKNSFAETTDSNGEITLTGVEWDLYTLAESSVAYDVLEICPGSSHSLLPGISDEVDMVLGSISSHLLRVEVENSSGDPIADATVRLENTGVDETSMTSLCGQTFFNSPSLYSDGNYTATVSATGYTTEIVGGVTVSSSSTLSVIVN
jgi:hypothetical protein